MSHWRERGRLTTGASHQPSAYRATTPRELPSGSILPLKSPLTDDENEKIALWAIPVVGGIGILSAAAAFFVAITVLRIWIDSQ